MPKFKFGRRPMVAPKMLMKFSGYQLKGFPTPPVEGDYSIKAMPALRQVYANNYLGDCVPVWMAHAESVFTGNATGHPIVFTDEHVIEAYSAIGGYDPNDPSTDRGCDENVALDYWLHHGFVWNNHKIAGALSLDATNEEECTAALWLFENLMYGVGLPQAWVDSIDTLKNGDTWDVAGPPIPYNGHCFGAVAWSPGKKVINTWGMNINLTNAATAKYAINDAGGQLFTVITPEIINRATQRAPNGFDWNYLKAEFNAMGGSI